MYDEKQKQRVYNVVVSENKEYNETNKAIDESRLNRDARLRAAQTENRSRETAINNATQQQLLEQARVVLREANDVLALAKRDSDDLKFSYDEFALFLKNPFQNNMERYLKESNLALVINIR